MNYTITEIATIVKAQKRAYKDYTITALLTDSRSLTFPEETLFFAPNETTATVTSKISTEKEYEISW